MDRIAEFVDLSDADRFRRMKGANDYDVVAGINLPWAVLPRQRYATEFRSDQPPESVAFDDDLEDDDER